MLNRTETAIIQRRVSLRHFYVNRVLVEWWDSGDFQRRMGEIETACVRADWCKEPPRSVMTFRSVVDKKSEGKPRE